MASTLPYIADRMAYLTDGKGYSFKCNCGVMCGMSHSGEGTARFWPSLRVAVYEAGVHLSIMHKDGK